MYKYRIIDSLEDVEESYLMNIVATLPKWRQDVVMRYKFLSGRRESALAFHLLQQMLLDEQIMDNKTVHDLEFIISEHGKPSIKDHEDIHFNISHCKHAVACAVSAKPVGIDVECIGRYSEGVAKYSLSDEELHSLYFDDKGKRRTEEDLEIQFTTLWTKKEALLKLIGTGITDDIKSVLSVYQDKICFETTVNEAKKYVCTIARYF